MNNKVIPMIPLYDRSRVVQDWKCARSRYWAYEHVGRGIVKSATPLALFTGITIHDSLAAIAEATREGCEVPIDDIVGKAEQQMRESLLEVSGGVDASVEFAFEQAALVEGMLRGFYIHVWPRLMAKYPLILAIEEEMEYLHDGLIFMSKPDLILGNDEETVYVEYKSTSSKKEGWVNSWDTAVQLHSTIRAVEATKGLKVDAVIVQGLYKGYESYGKQNSPFCYAYARNGNPPFTADQISYEYKAGLKRTPTWKMPGGVKAWVEGMPFDVLQGQFPQTAPIFINDDLVDAFFRQRGLRENEIATASRLLADPASPEDNQALLDRVFPQKWEACSPYFGAGCDFKRLCHGHVNDPIGEGFEARTPHHQKELDQFEETL